MAEIKVIGNDIYSFVNKCPYKIKNNITLDDVYESEDFWYDLFDGGYINPEQILEDQESIDKINKAIEVLEEFKAIYTSISDYMFDALED